jgi:hypothetical protein
LRMQLSWPLDKRFPMNPPCGIRQKIPRLTEDTERQRPASDWLLADLVGSAAIVDTG